MTIFYFTTTGNSLYVAKKICDKNISIVQEFRINRSFVEDDKIGFVFPCYAGGMPDAVHKFIDKVTFKADYYFAIVTNGGSAIGALESVKNLGEKYNLKFDYLEQVHMISNYLPLSDINDELKNESLLQIEENIERIKNDIQNSVKKDFKPKMYNYALSSVANKMFYMLFTGDCDKKFSVSDECTGCKICENVCYRHNITVIDKPKFHHQCGFCMGCINNCPKTAINVKGEKSSGRFRNNNVTITELIKSNNQTR